MNTLVIIAHPSLETSTINRTWAEALNKTECISVLDLYKTYPTGEIDVEKEQARLLVYDRIIFQFPMYWYSSPYLLSKYMDEVFLEGYAYGKGGNALEGKDLGVAISCGSAEENFAEGAQQRHSLASYMNVYDGIAGFLRANYIGFHSFYDTFNPEALKTLGENTIKYIKWIKEA